MVRVLRVRRDRHGVLVQLGDVLDLVVADLLALVAEGLAHLLPLVAGVEQDDLAPQRRCLPVGQDPEVRGDAGVVEELVRQRDDALQPVVLQDPAPDLRLARPGRPGEQRRAVEDDRQPAALVLDRAPSWRSCAAGTGTTRR